MPRFTVRFSDHDPLVGRIRVFARSHTDGNEAEAIRRLIAEGLASADQASLVEEAVARKLDEGIERMAKIASRGAKASLAGLVLSATYLPPMADAAGETARLVAEASRLQGAALPTDSVDAALSPLARHRSAVPAGAFGFAWTAGGRLQAMKGGADYQSAVMGISAAPEQAATPAVDLWGGAR